MCPAGQPMYFYKEYTEKNKDPNKPDKVKRLYNNYYACKHCIHRESCLTEKTHKTITEYGSEMQKAMNQKMEKQEYKDEYAKRSSVEGPFGIFKEQYHANQEIVIGMVKTEEINLEEKNLKKLQDFYNKIGNE